MREFAFLTIQSDQNVVSRTPHNYFIANLLVIVNLTYMIIVVANVGFQGWVTHGGESLSDYILDLVVAFIFIEEGFDYGFVMLNLE